MVTKDDVKQWMREVIAEQARPTEDPVSHVVGCKNCYEGVIKKANETMPYHCVDCGLPLPKELIDAPFSACPNCGSLGVEETEE